MAEPKATQHKATQHKAPGNNYADENAAKPDRGGPSGHVPHDATKAQRTRPDEAEEIHGGGTQAPVEKGRPSDTGRAGS